MITQNTTNKALKNVLATMSALTESNKDFRNVSLYAKTESDLLHLISDKELTEKTELSRVTFQILDSETKRNSTVYIYFRANNIYCFECSNSFLKDYKTSDFESLKRFKETRTNLLTNDIERTFKSLMTHKAIITESKTETKKATTNKATKKKEVKAKAK